MAKMKLGKPYKNIILNDCNILHITTVVTRENNLMGSLHGFERYISPLTVLLEHVWMKLFMYK